MPADTTVQKSGLLMVWTDIPPHVEAHFNEWYNREHMPDRIIGIPGFTRGRRFVAIEGGPKYLALYETTSAQVFRSEPYLAINRNPDPKSRCYIPLFIHTIKGICDIEARIGSGEGGLLAALPVSIATDREVEFSAWACATLLPEVVRADGVIAATFARRNRAIQEIAAASYTRAGDRYAESVLVIEAANEGGLATAVAALSPATLAQHGARTPLMDQACTLRTIFALHA